MTNSIIFVIEKLGKVTAGSFLLPHKENFIFTNDFFFEIFMSRC